MIRTLILQVTFEGTVGSSFTGDLAIDDVSITNGSCQGKTTPSVLPAITFFNNALLF